MDQVASVLFKDLDLFGALEADIELGAHVVGLVLEILNLLNVLDLIACVKFKVKCSVKLFVKFPLFFKMALFVFRFF